MTAQSAPTVVLAPDDPSVPPECVSAAQAADGKSGVDTVILDMGALVNVTDAFVITSGRNTRQVRTIVDEVERQLAEHHGLRPLRVEGQSDASWVLMDYGDFVVHVFLEETRGYYDLEHLWSDAPRVPWLVGDPS
ncbi:MAG: ribosome silencing factor [Acidimicrobiales bacterium]|nr:ribosome silencing factor [Acidimicrobiales bacterium]